MSRRLFHVALGTVANKRGRICGANIGGGDLGFPGVVGTAVMKFCELEVGQTGPQEREAGAVGFDYAVGEIVSTTRASYYLGATELTSKVLADKGRGRLLGALVVGAHGAAKRIDVLATAIAAGMTAEEFE